MVEIKDIIAFKDEAGVLKHMVVFEGPDGEHCTQPYGKDELHDRGSLTQCHDEIVTRYGIEAGDNQENRKLQSDIIGRHFYYMHTGKNAVGQEYVR